jgi:hypothetical protein
LQIISRTTHRPLAEIIESLPDGILNPILTFPGVRELLAVESIEVAVLREAFQRRYAKL